MWGWYQFHLHWGLRMDGVWCAHWRVYSWKSCAICDSGWETFTDDILYISFSAKDWSLFRNNVSRDLEAPGLDSVYIAGLNNVTPQTGHFIFANCLEKKPGDYISICCCRSSEDHAWPERHAKSTWCFKKIDRKIDSLTDDFSNGVMLWIEVKTYLGESRQQVWLWGMASGITAHSLH